MVLIQSGGVKKSYGLRTVIEYASLDVYQGDKIGIVGSNGAGKSTLLGILSGEILPEEGVVTRHCTPAYIRQFEERDSTRSGGENAKEAIRRETDSRHEILLADEPTANLDAQGQKWVLQKLKRADTVLLISHDRDLLDAVCTRIIEVKDGALTHYTGNYSDYEAAVEVKKQQNALAVEEYRQKKAQLEGALSKKRKQAANTTKAPSRMGNSEARLAKDKAWSKQKKAERQAVVLKSRLERLEPVEREKAPPPLRIDFSLTDPPENRHVITCENLSFAYGDRRIFRDASFAVERGVRAAVTGDNGAGKTTLLRLIYGGDDAIRTAPKLRCGYLRQDFSHIHPEKTVLENALADSVQDLAAVRSALAGLLFRRDDVYKKAQVLSGGEKMRLSIAMLITSSCNALLLDEPTNYLDVRSLEAVARVLCQYPGTILLVSHDRRFVEQVSTTELMVTEGKVVSRERFEQQKTAPRQPDAARKLLLEVRTAQLLGEISSAPPARKDLLEQEYAQALRELKELA